MIAQFIFFISLFLVGYLFLCLIAPTIEHCVVVCLSPLMGMCVVVFGIIFSVILPVPFYKITVILLIVVLYCILAGIRFYSDKYIKILSAYFSLKSILIGLFIYGALALLLMQIACVTISSDAFMTLGLAHYLANGGVPTEYFYYARQIFAPAMHSMGVLFGLDNINVVYPVMSVWFLGIVYILLSKMLSGHGMSKSRSYTLSFLGAVSVASIGMYYKHSFYVGDNLFSAIFFTVVIMGLYFNGVERKKDWLAISSVFLAFFVLLRMENIFISLIPISMFLGNHDMQAKRNDILFFGTFFMIILPWFIYGTYRIFDIWGYEILNCVDKGPKLLAALVGAFGYFLSLLFLILYSIYGKYWRIMRRNIQWLLAFPLVLALLAGMYLFPEKSGESVYASVINMFNVHMWGITWGYIIGMFFLIVMFSRSEEKELFLPVICSVIAVSFLTVYGRLPFRIGWGDSFNRMLLHVVPVIIMYVCVEVARYVAVSKSDESLISQ